MFPAPQVASCSYDTFLCLRRGVSEKLANEIVELIFSLPTQRCFLLRRIGHQVHPLFSAYAEVFPRWLTLWGRLPAFLCLRRGVSLCCWKLKGGYRFSLPTQRCFHACPLLHPRWPLFSAYAEVFLEFSLIVLNRLPFLCLRRGVSSVDLRALGNATFSLPTQRCFYARRLYAVLSTLFSAYAEVFPWHPLQLG